jgi:membrane-associated protease RseP (regulator of RpoE activity)
MSEFTPPLPATYETHGPIEVFVVRPPRRRYWLHALLLLATIFTTLVVGARLEYNFLHNLPAFSAEPDALPLFPVMWVFQEPWRLLLGLPFSATLMLILLAHEMGHYVYCLRYGVNATLPFFIPAPTLIGTLGAFIRIKSPIRSRAALFDIGIAGPIAGFLMASITLIFALTLSKPMPPGIPASEIEFGYPLIFHLLHSLSNVVGGSGTGQIPLSATYLHPTAIAAWVGMFATALNLLPGGQLDGGHIVYALSPKAHRYVSTMTVTVLLTLGGVALLREFGLLLLPWAGWEGWFIWGLLIKISGVRHPNVPIWPGLSPRRKSLVIVALLLLVLTFVPSPLTIRR